MKTTLRVFLLMGFAYLLFGCGEAKDLSGQLTVDVTPPSSSSQPGEVTATYVPSKSVNPTGLKIDFSTDRPDILLLDARSREVGSTGQAKVTFRVLPVTTATSVTITATTGGLSAFKVITLNPDSGQTSPPPPPPVTNQTPSQIRIESTSPTDKKLALKGTGSTTRPETGYIRFKVIDLSQAPVANQSVNFTLSPAFNGGAAISPASAVTDVSGLVTVVVSSGSIQSPLTVTATLDSNPSLSATEQLSVTSGPPDDDSFSISAATLNIEAFNHDGETNTISVRLADHFNNPPPSGTVVLFTTNGGKIAGSGVTDDTGNVSVTWTSQEPRPSNGRFVILAYTVGEESFTDLNGNGLADTGEFTDTGTAFRDDNMNGIRDGNEPYIPFNPGDGYSTGDGRYNGTYPGAAYSADPRQKHIFRNIELVMSTDHAVITDTCGAITGPATCSVTVTDGNGNTMASGTTISISTDNGKLSGTTSYVVPNNTGYGDTIPILISSDGTVNAGGAIKIDVKGTHGLVTTHYIPITGGV
ncbi:MAG: hypothetical protein Fur0034_09970 [Desulfuromonadia bacterium]